MRPDFAKLLCERPRTNNVPDAIRRDGRRSRPRPRMNADGEDLRPKQAPMRPIGERKQLNENLSPLYRYLGSQVGRPWANVYSEIRRHIKPSSATQMHILQHLGWYVDQNEHEPKASGQFYVQQKTGLLCRRPVKRWPTYRHPGVVVLLSDTKAYRLHEGIWWEVALDKVKDPPRRYNATDEERARFLSIRDAAFRTDCLFHEKVPCYQCDHENRYGKAGLYATSKRQLGKRDIRRLRREGVLP